LIDGHEAIEGAAGLPDADVLEDHAIKGERTAHSFVGAIQDRARIVGRDLDLDAVQDAGVVDAGDGRLQPLLPGVG
jgi:hypothetical protein